MSFSKKLMIGAIILVIVPTLTTGGYTVYKAKSEMAEMATASLMNTTGNVVDMLDSYLSARIDMLRELSRSQAIVGLFTSGGGDDKQRVERANARLAEFARVYGDDASVVFVANASGRVIASNTGGRLIGDDISGRGVFKAAMLGKETLEDLTLVKSTMEMHNTFTLPIRIEGQVVGTISYLFSLKPIEDEIVSLRFVETGSICLVDSAGMVFIFPNSEIILPISIRSLVGHDEIMEALSKEEYSLKMHSSSLSDELIVYGGIKSIGWGVISIWDEDYFLSPANDIQFMSFMFGVLFLLIAYSVVSYLKEGMLSQQSTSKVDLGKNDTGQVRKQKFKHRVNSDPAD